MKLGLVAFLLKQDSVYKVIKILNKIRGKYGRPQKISHVHWNPIVWMSNKNI